MNVTSINDKRYTCQVCRDQFKDIENLELHTKIHTMSRDFTQISSSSKVSSTSLDSTFNRMPMTTNESMCAEVLANIIDLHGRNKVKVQQVNASSQTCSITSKYFKCTLCDKDFCDHVSLDSDTKIHSNNEAKCEEVLADILDLHIKNKTKSANNLQDKLFKCMFCHKTFTKKHSLDAHSKLHAKFNYKLPYAKDKDSDSVHFNLFQKAMTKKDFKCTFCKEMFRDIGSLKAHTKNHNNKEFKYKETRGFSSLNSTIKKQSKGNKVSYKLAISSPKTSSSVVEQPLTDKKIKCEQSFEKQNSLDSHIKIHYQEDLKQTKEAFADSIGLNVSSKRKEYKCSYCKEAFEDISSLKIHSLKHISPNSCSNPTEFKCTFCSNSFQDLIALDIHTQLHTESRDSFRCGYCEQIFATFDILSEHVHVHMKENKANDSRQWLICNSKNRKVTERQAQNRYLVTTSKSTDNTFTVPPTRLARKVTAITAPTGRVKQQTQKRTKPVTIICSNKTKNNPNNTNFTPRVKFIATKTPFKCTFCHKEFSKSGKLKRHIRIHTGEKPYKCPHCDKCFTQSGNLTHHLRTHNGDKPYVCNICKKPFSQSSSLTIHKRSHTGERPFVCCYCDKRFSHSGPLNHHIRTHTGEKPFKCQFCEKAFPQSSQLNQHVRIHTGEKPYKCSVCNKKFTQSSSLNIHIRSHTGERPFKCQYCEKAFAQSGKLKQHLKVHVAEKNVTCLWPSCSKQVLSGKLTHHLWTHMGDSGNNGQPLKCDICDRVFTHASNLSQHLRLHTGEKVYECKKCEKVFTQANKLTVHVKSSHTGERPYRCRFCVKTFSQSADLTLHERTHTGEKPYCCDICQRHFSQTGSLTRHRRTHTGEKPFRCEICGKAFSQSSGLAQHMKIHTQEKPYSCRYCGKAFSFSSKLKEHLTIHTNEKPFRCKICDKQFRSSSNLSNHKKQCGEGGNSSNNNTLTFSASSQSQRSEASQQLSQTLTITTPLSLQPNSHHTGREVLEDVDMKPNLSDFTDSEFASIYTFSINIIGNKDGSPLTTSAVADNTEYACIDTNNIMNIGSKHYPISEKNATNLILTSTTALPSQIDIFVQERKTSAAVPSNTFVDLQQQSIDNALLNINDLQEGLASYDGSNVSPLNNSPIYATQNGTILSNTDNLTQSRSDANNMNKAVPLVDKSQILFMKSAISSNVEKPKFEPKACIIKGPTALFPMEEALCNPNIQNVLEKSIFTTSNRNVFNDSNNTQQSHELLPKVGYIQLQSSDSQKDKLTTTKNQNILKTSYSNSTSLSKDSISLTNVKAINTFAGNDICQKTAIYNKTAISPDVHNNVNIGASSSKSHNVSENIILHFTSNSSKELSKEIM